MKAICNLSVLTILACAASNTGLEEKYGTTQLSVSKVQVPRYYVLLTLESQFPTIPASPDHIPRPQLEQSHFPVYL